MVNLAQIGPTLWVSLCNTTLKSFWLAPRIIILRNAVFALSSHGPARISLSKLATIARERCGQDANASFPARWIQLLAKKADSRPREANYLTSLALTLNYLAEVNADCLNAIRAQNVPLADLIEALAREPAIDRVLRHLGDAQPGNTGAADDRVPVLVPRSEPGMPPRRSEGDSDPVAGASYYNPFTLIPPSNSDVDFNFFRSAGIQDAMSQPRTSNYVVYRHSTIKSHIVKTFLAIASPLVRNTEWFTFMHVYTDPRREIKRISSGVISSLHGTVYLVGSKVVVPFETLANSIVADGGQLPVGLVQGIKIIAIPHSRLTPNPTLATGVFLSNAGEWQPIVGRFAMVHLGFSTKIGAINETDAGIAILDGERKFREDIEAMSARFPDMLGHHTIDGVQDYVLKRITNVNQFDLNKRWRSENARRALVPESVPPGIEPGR